MAEIAYGHYFRKCIVNWYFRVRVRFPRAWPGWHTLEDGTCYDGQKGGVLDVASTKYQTHI